MTVHELGQNTRMGLLVDNLLGNASVEVGMGFQLEKDIEGVYEEKNLKYVQDKHIRIYRYIIFSIDTLSIPTTLVPRLTFRVYLSALLSLDHDAWKAVCRER